MVNRIRLTLLGKGFFFFKLNNPFCLVLLKTNVPLYNIQSVANV